MDGGLKILLKILKEIKPPEAEIRETQELFFKIQLFITEKFGLNADLMGSVAKGTFLAGDKDLDIFVFFQPETKRSILEKMGLAVGSAVFRHFRSRDFRVSYAEHPYTKGKIAGFHVEIVPAYKVESAEAILSAVDRTPFHKAYVLEHLKNPDDVRLVKKFLKGIGCYGSDLKTQGFSGYLCELLSVKYGTFENILRACQKWRHQEIIDISNRFQPEAEKLSTKWKEFTKHEYSRLRKKFGGPPLIFLDPTDRNRNVAAVLSEEKLATFIFRARRFLEKPDASYFSEERKKIDRPALLKHQKEKGTDLVVVTFRKPDAIEDILYPQLRRFEANITKLMKHEGFEVLDSWTFADKECGIAVELLSGKLPKYRKMRGPSVFNPAKHQDKFLEKYKKAWIEGDSLMAEAKREHATAGEFFRVHLKGSGKKLANTGIPSTIAESLKKGFKIADFARIKSDEFWRGLGKETLK